MIGIYLPGAFIIGGLLFFNRNKLVNTILVVAFLILQWVFTVYEYMHMNKVELLYFKPDALAVLLLTTLSIIAIPAMYHSSIYLKSNNDPPRNIAIYFSATVILLSVISAAYLSNHIAVNWIFIELTTLSASALIYHRRNNRTLEGTWKYVFVCAISITFVFIGILFLSFSLHMKGGDNLSFDALLGYTSIINLFWARLAFIFIFTGLTVKLSLVPMYTAGIDAKDKAPSPAGALFSSVLMNVGFVAFFRVYVVYANTPLHSWANHVILISALLSIFVATVYMVKVKNIKRMLAYSSIEHMGIIMLGIVAGGIGYYAAILHLILHSFIKSSIFFQVGQVYRIYKSKSIYDVGNYFRYNTTGAVVMLLCFIWVTAMPPSGLFISELMIFGALFRAHLILVMVVVMFFLTVIIWAFGKNMFKLLFAHPVGFDDSHVARINPAESISQFIFLGLIVYLGINPPVEFVNLIYETIKNLPK